MKNALVSVVQSWKCHKAWTKWAALYIVLIPCADAGGAIFIASGVFYADRGLDMLKRLTSRPAHSSGNT